MRNRTKPPCRSLASVTEYFSVESHEVYRALQGTCDRLDMQGSWADGVWATMTRGEYYSIRDLANLTEHPRSAVADVLRFLTNYGFVNRMGTEEPVFTKSTVEFSPGETINLLKCIANP